jgi:GNAT superfamily N-acetyltransferase
VIRTASCHDLPALRALFARANDAPYALETVAEEKCFGDGIAGAPMMRVFEHDGRIAGAAVTCGKWLRVLIVDRELRRRGIGTALLEDSGARVIAAEPGNYFVPGVLESEQAFFRARGYREGAATWNLHVVLSGDPSGGLKARRSTADEVLPFIEREFGRIWRFEAARAQAIFITEDGGSITGFAAIEANNRGLGTFGPTGVAKALRGRGLGRELLLAALAELHRLGYARAVIPWTDALDFYRKSCGAEAAHRFVAFEKREP